MSPIKPFPDLLSPDYKASAPLYGILDPPIPTGDIYHFHTSSGLLYEVQFGRKKDNYFSYVINLGVIDEHFENEYSMTHENEVFSVISTVIEIIHRFQVQHPLSESFEFTGEFKGKDRANGSSIRTRLFYRTACRVLNVKCWKAELLGNKVVIHLLSEHHGKNIA